MAASCCLGSRDTPSEHHHPPYGHSPSLDGWAHASHGARGQAVGTGPGAWGCRKPHWSPARPLCAQSFHLDVYKPPFHVFLYFFFFCWKQDSIHIEYNIFVYLTGRGGGGDSGGAGPAARYSSPRGHWGRDPRPLPSPLCTVLRGNTHLVSKECILRCVFVCMCVRLWF